MFPYPSGSLHMGHIRVYGLSDVLARYYRMCGRNVFHPMGWDAFGLPAENAAFERGEDPDKWTQTNIANMKSLMEEMNFSFDWSREFATCDSDYYKWTQFLFLKMYEAGLVYRREAIVNWDPVDNTVLAHEQVDAYGRSWRSGAVVEKKLLKQWFVRTTTFAKSLHDGLRDPILSDLKDVVDIQEHWIGEVTGTLIDFEIVDQMNVNESKKMPVWIKNPEYIDRAMFLIVKPKSLWSFGCESNGLLPYRVKNPFTNQTLPVYLSEDFEFLVGSEIHLGIPDLSEQDQKFALSVGIPYTQGLQTVAKKEELLDLRKKICEEAIERGIGGYPCSAKLQDWLISRQRYWGTPIPMILCEKCGEQPVAEKDLPVKLPKGISIKKKEKTLKEFEDWYLTTCPKCGGKATRETDTMDTFVDSSWYFLRYLDPDNEQAAFSVKKAEKFMPVDLYIGGKEHATLHLYYARFMNHFLHSVGLVPTREPFLNLMCQGMVKGKTYSMEKTGEYIKTEMVVQENGKFFHKETKEPVKVEWEKMCKSKHNGVDPKDLLNKYGVDLVRLVILEGPSPWQHRNWEEEQFLRMLNWQSKLWKIIRKFIELRSSNSVKPEETEKYKKLDYFVYDTRNFYLDIVTKCLSDSFNVGKAIAKMQGLTKVLIKSDPDIVTFSPNYEKALADHIIMLAPVVPCFASELWAGFLSAPNRLNDGNEILWDKPVLHQPWPEVDANYVMRSEKVSDMLNISVRKPKNKKKNEKNKNKAADIVCVDGEGDKEKIIEPEKKSL